MYAAAEGFQRYRKWMFGFITNTYKLHIPFSRIFLNNNRKFTADVSKHHPPDTIAHYGKK